MLVSTLKIQQIKNPRPLKNRYFILIIFSLTPQSERIKAQQVPALTKSLYKHIIFTARVKISAVWSFWCNILYLWFLVILEKSENLFLSDYFCWKPVITPCYRYFLYAVELTNKIQAEVAPMKYLPISLRKMAPWYGFAQITAFGRVFKRAHPLLTGRSITPIPYPLTPNVTSFALLGVWNLTFTNLILSFSTCEVKQSSLSHSFVSLLHVVAWKARSQLASSDHISLSWEEEKK